MILRGVQRRGVLEAAVRSVALWAISRGGSVALQPSRSTVVLGRAGCAGVAPCGSSDVEPHDGAPAADPEQEVLRRVSELLCRVTCDPV
jgi:hypothetical protein